MAEDPFGFIKDFLREVEKETKEKVGDEYYIWSEHHNTWIDIIQPILRNVSEFDKKNSLVIFRLLELQNQLFWVMFSVHCGKYHSGIRELRYVLDSMLQAYYLDMQHPKADIKCKLEILKEIDREAFGSRLIERLNVKHKENLKQLYSDLSKYIHSSYQELRPVIEEGREVDSRITYAFDETLFNRCAEFTNRVMDAIYFIVFNRFPQLIELGKQDKLMVNLFEEYNCKLSLECIKNSDIP